MDGESASGCPIAKDFDHTSEAHARNWHATYEAFREGCPHARSDQHGGYWVASHYKDVMGGTQSQALSTEKFYDADTDTFSGGILIPTSPVGAAMPAEAPPESWRGYRTFLNRRFSPATAEAQRPIAQSIARTLIDRVIEKGSIDFVEDLTSPLPALVTMEMFGFDLSSWKDFSEPVHKYQYFRQDNPGYGEIIDKLNAIMVFLDEQAADRKRNPRDDLMTYIATGEVDGVPLTDYEIRQLSLNLIFGGVDTTTALTSNGLYHLGRFPEDRQRLIDDPELRPLAREEFLRFYTPVHAIGRTVVEDTSLNGWELKQGERILLALASANHDPRAFERPDQFQIDRQPNRHIGFGGGMHHCLGRFMAKMMFDVMLDEVLTRLPDYRMNEGGIERYSSVDKVNGFVHLPATFTPGTVIGGGMAF